MKTYKFFKTIYRALNILVILMMTLNAPLSVFAYTTTDKPDYSPGEIVTIMGDNSDGLFYQVGVAVDVVVTGPTVNDHYYCTSEPALEDGSWSCTVTLSEDPLIAVGYYSYVTMQNGVVIEEGGFTDAAPPKLSGFEQCDPPTPFDPTTYTCEYNPPTGWVSGNNDGLLYEGDTIPYRALMSKLIVDNQYSLTIKWDTTKAGKHAIDYLKTYDATILNADACSGLGLPVGFCDAATSTYEIPPDTFMQSAPDWIGVQDEGEFTMFGGTITGLSPYTPPLSYDGDTTTYITIYYTANTPDVLLAWGGHIGERADWGQDNSAVFISGSPYHMAISDFYDETNDVALSSGSMDLQLSAEAVIYPAHVTIVKEAYPQGETLFNFTGDLVDFSLKDNGNDPNQLTFEVTEFVDPYTITELVPSGWALWKIDCELSTDVISTTIPSAVLDVDEAEYITCYFRNEQQTGNIIIEKFTDPSGSTLEFEFNPSWSETNFFLSDGEWVDSGQLMAGTYSVAEIVPEGWELSDATCNDGESTVDNILLQAGETITCTFSNYRNAMDLTVSKTAVPHFTRTYTWDITKTADDPLTRYGLPGEMVDFGYDVFVNHDGGVDSGWYVDGVITITNPNTWEAITLTSLSDSAIGASCVVDDGPYVVPADGSLDVGYRCDFGSGVSGTNTATATWDAATYHTPSGSASGTANYAFTTPATLVDESITVTDTAGGALGTASVGESMPKVFYYTHSWVAVGGTCTDYPNTASFVTNDTGATGSDGAEVTVCSGLDLTVTKTALGTFGRTYLWDIDKSVDETSISIADGGLATFNYTVDVWQTGVLDAGWTLSGVITISNPNDWEAITLTSLADVVDNGGSCTVDAGPYVIPASGSIDVNYSCSFASAPSSYSGKNTATATWDELVYFTPTGTASGSEDFTLSQLGSTNKTVTVTDTLGGTLGTVTATDVAPYASAEFTYAKDFEGVGGTCTEYDNTATITETKQSDSVTVEVCVGLDLTVSKTAAGTFNRTYLWDIDKSVDETSISIADGGLATFNYTVDVWQTGVLDAGWTLSGVITISNPNDWEAITLTSLADVVDNGGSCTVDAGPYVIPASGSIDVNYSCSFASAPSSYSGKNTATATWDELVYFTPTGTASGSEDFTLSQLGSTNKTVTVTDTLGGTLGTVTATDVAPYASAEFTYAKDFEGVGGTCTEYDNTATITETKQSDSVTVEVCVGLDLTVSKTAAGTFDRTYLWDIMKDVDKTYVEAIVGDLITFNYTVKVWQTGFADSNWSLIGKITVSNPNDWQDIVATVTDLYPGGVCTVVGGVNVTVPKGSFVELDYSCTFLAQPSYTGTNTATAVWDAAAYFTPTGTASGTAIASFTKVNEINKEIHVTDSYAGALGTVMATDVAPWTEATINYSRDITASYVPGCMNYENTATIVETEQSDDANVQICTYYWAYTPGFWKNHTIDPRNAWLLTEFSTDTVLSSVFTFNEYLSSLHPKGMSSDTFGDITLLEALSLKGGSGVSGALEILMRAAAAAVLNTSFHETLDVEEHPAGVAVYNTDLEREVLMSCDPVDPDCVDPVIYYPFTTASLIEKVNLVLAVYTKNGVGDPALMLDLAAMLDGYNNGIEYMDWSWLEPYMPFP